MTSLKHMYVCPNCEYTGHGKVPGSTFITLILLCFFIVPGVIYYFWRASRKDKVCPKCGAKPMVPYDTKKGRELSPLSEGQVKKKILWNMLPYYILGAIAIAFVVSMVAITKATT